MVASYMTSSEDLDAGAAKRLSAAHENRTALVEDLARPSKTAVGLILSRHSKPSKSVKHRFGVELKARLVRTWDMPIAVQRFPRVGKRNG